MYICWSVACLFFCFPNGCAYTHCLMSVFLNEFDCQLGPFWVNTAETGWDCTYFVAPMAPSVLARYLHQVTSTMPISRERTDLNPGSSDPRRGLSVQLARALSISSSARCILQWTSLCVFKTKQNLISKYRVWVCCIHVCLSEHVGAKGKHRVSSSEFHLLLLNRVFLWTWSWLSA